MSTKNSTYSIKEDNWGLCEPIAEYCKKAAQAIRELSLFSVNSNIVTEQDDIRVVELFAGVGGFRIGLERASKHYKTIWSNQWEPSTKRQDASMVYCHRFGEQGHSNEDIATVPTSEIPQCDLRPIARMPTAFRRGMKALFLLIFNVSLNGFF